MATPIPKNQATLTAWDLVQWDTKVRIRGDGAVARGVVTDSRAVVPGCAFVALRGKNVDGNDFVADAVRAGAVLVVTERELETDKADVVVAENVEHLLGVIARNHLRAWRRSRRGLDPARTVCVTGSAGKTTTKQIAAALLGSVGETYASAGNLNNAIGLPMSALMVEQRHRFAVLEVGMSLPSEIENLGASAEPDVAIITNVGVAHAEGVGGSRADVAREKGRLYACLTESGTAVVNADDPAVVGQLSVTCAREVVFFGRSERADYRLLTARSRGKEGARITFERRGKDMLEVDSPLLGEAAAIDFLAALAAAEAAAGAPLQPSSIQSAMRTLENASQRGDVITLSDGTLVIDDTYNANPHSMLAALSILAELARGEQRRAVAILGEMKELGQTSKDEHASLGAVLAQEGVGLVIGTGGLIDHSLAGADALGVKTLTAASVEEATEIALREIAPTDVVLVKASRSVGAEAIVRALQAARGKKP